MMMVREVAVFLVDVEDDADVEDDDVVVVARFSGFGGG